MVPADEDGGAKASLTAARHSELLRIARKSRMYWVLQARDQIPKGTAKIADEENKAHQIDKLANVPAALAIQQVLDFLNRTIDDGNDIDLDSLLLSLDDTEETSDEDLLKQFAAQDNDLSSYDLFLKKLLHPQAGPAVKALQQFVGQFTARARDQRAKRALDVNHRQTEREVDDQVKAWSGSIYKFLDHLHETMRACPIWASNPSDLEKDKPNAEKFVFVQLHGAMFGSDAEDLQLNRETAERIASLGFVSAQHLDIKSFKHLPHYHSSTYSPLSDPLLPVLTGPVKHLCGLDAARCPADKLACLRACSAAIAQILKEVRADGSLPGADELLPTMILVIKLCNPANIHSQIKYLQRYTRPEKLVSEAGYLLTNFVSAVFFLDNVNAQALTIEPDEFDQAVTMAKKRARQVMGSASKRDMGGTGGELLADGVDDDRVDCVALVAEYKAALKATKQREFVALRDC